MSLHYYELSLLNLAKKKSKIWGPTFHFGPEPSKNMEHPWLLATQSSSSRKRVTMNSADSLVAFDIVVSNSYQVCSTSTIHKIH